MCGLLSKQSIFIGIYFFVVITISYASVDYCKTDLCAPGIVHIACKNDGKTFDKSCKQPKHIKIKPKLKKQFVKKHNEWRQVIAAGNISHYEPAERMGVMKWDDSLAKMAGMNAIHCKFEHDKCRNSKKYPQSGQNLYIHCSSKPNNDFVALINNATDSWFNEYQICDMSFIDKYHDTDLEIGHFTMMAKDKAQYVGCNIVQYRNDKNDMDCQYVVCNYDRTNVLDRSTYRKGNPGTGCKSGCDKDYPSLCSSKEKYLSDKEEAQMESDAARALAKLNGNGKAVAKSYAKASSGNGKAIAKSSAKASGKSGKAKAKSSAKASGKSGKAKAKSSANASGKSGKASAKAVAKASGQSGNASATSVAIANSG